MGESVDIYVSRATARHPEDRFEMLLPNRSANELYMRKPQWGKVRAMAVQNMA